MYKRVQNEASSPARRNKAERQAKKPDPVMERIESGLTVDIARDLYDTTGKPPPNVVYRASVGASPKGKAARYAEGIRNSQASSPQRRTAKSAMKHTASYKRQPVENMCLTDQFGISLGQKMFKNEAFESRIRDVQAQIEEMKRERGDDGGQAHSPLQYSPKKTGFVVDDENVDQFYKEM